MLSLLAIDVEVDGVMEGTGCIDFAGGGTGEEDDTISSGSSGMADAF